MRCFLLSELFQFLLAVPMLVLVSSPVARAQTPLNFIPVTPCRVADTRMGNGTFGAPSISADTSRDFPIPQSSCGIPNTAAAYSLNFTVVPHGSLGYLTVWPTGLNQPVVSTLNSPDGRIKANAAIVPAGSGGAISAFVTDTTDLIIDVNGYFVTDTSQLAFYPLSPCRVLDTRDPTGLLGGPVMAANRQRDFPIQSSSCGIPFNAQAYSLNFTVVPQHTLGYLTVWPSGVSQPVVSTLNSPTGAITANAAIVPAGVGGDISAYVTDNADLVADINGYFAPPGYGGQSLYSTAPCRVLDTRNSSGAFKGQLPVKVVSAPCAMPQGASAFVFNATAVPQRTLGYLTLWPDSQSQPVVSTLNAFDGAITSNMAIVPTSNGSVDAFTTDPSDLILDAFSYFASSGGTVDLLSVGITGSGTGSIVTADGRINCPSICSADYFAGSWVTLTAAADPGSMFLGWSGGGCSGTAACTVPINSATVVTAMFSLTNSTMTWNVKLDSSCIYTTYFRLFDENRSLVWPNAQNVWVMGQINQIYTEPISCTTGDTICIGASENSSFDTTYWGVGINNTKPYVGSMCQVCGSYTAPVQNLTCY